MKPFDYVIVGAGLYGATAAYALGAQGKRCLVVDRRESTGGNIRCEQMAGINVHKYGAHIFHTADAEVWQLVNRLVPFNRYTNSPVARYGEEQYNLPFNMNTFHALWGVKTPAEAQAILDEQRAEAIAAMRAAGATEPRNLEEQALALIGRDIYERLIKGYTEKQWGRPCTELPAFIIRRLPVRLVYDNNYFNDPYQGIPIGGYNRLIDGLLARADVRTGVDFATERAALEAAADTIIYTGQIDEFFNYRYGHLAWRTVTFETEVLDTPNHQGNAVVNYTERSVPYTRVIEHKHFEAFGQAVYDNPQTVISREYSTEWLPGMEPYYPVNDPHNEALYARYRALAEAATAVTPSATQPRYLFGGRLAEYKYYDMAPVMRRALDAFAK